MEGDFRSFPVTLTQKFSGAGGGGVWRKWVGEVVQRSHQSARHRKAKKKLRGC